MRNAGTPLMLPLQNTALSRAVAVRLSDYCWITVSAALTAVAVNIFFQSSGLAPGGITGLSIIFSLASGIPVAYMTLCIAIPLLFLATLLLGKAFGAKTLYITLATPVFLKLIPNVDTMTLLRLPRLLNLILFAIAGGLLVGSAIGIALKRGCATGGTDVIALLIQHFLKFPKVSNILLVLDGSVIIASGFISGDYRVAVLSFFSLCIIIRTIKFITARPVIS